MKTGGEFGRSVVLLTGLLVALAAAGPARSSAGEPLAAQEGCFGEAETLHEAPVTVSGPRTQARFALPARRVCRLKLTPHNP